MSDLVLIEARGSVALITLNRPVKLNALDYALIDRLLEILDLLATAFALAHTIAAKSPLAVAACLGSATRGLNVAIDEGLAIEASWFARMAGTRDIEEGISAWLARRAPQFIGT